MRYRSSWPTFDRPRAVPPGEVRTESCAFARLAVMPGNAGPRPRECWILLPLLHLDSYSPGSNVTVKMMAELAICTSRNAGCSSKLSRDRLQASAENVLSEVRVPRGMGRIKRFATMRLSTISCRNLSLLFWLRARERSAHIPVVQ